MTVLRRDFVACPMLTDCRSRALSALWQAAFDLRGARMRAHSRADSIARARRARARYGSARSAMRGSCVRRAECSASSSSKSSSASSPAATRSSMCSRCPSSCGRSSASTGRGSVSCATRAEVKRAIEAALNIPARGAAVAAEDAVLIANLRAADRAHARIKAKRGAYLHLPK